MKFQRNRYQHGSIRKVPRSGGWVWEFRFYCTGADGVRKPKAQIFDPVKYPTERDVRLAVQPQLAALNSGTLAGRIDATLVTIIDRYMKEEFPALRHSTQVTNQSLLNCHIKPKWQDTPLAEVTALAVKQWVDRLPVGGFSKARARNMISKLLDLAMLWEFIPVDRNPMQLVKVKGSTKRQKRITIITPEQFRAVVDTLPEPYNLMVLVTGCLGLRVSETLALQWPDFDWDEDEGALTINRVFTHGELQELPKTEAGGDPLPIYKELGVLLLDWKRRQPPVEDGQPEWVFPSPRTGHCYSDSTILSKYLKPAAVKLGIAGFGWYTLRHSYKSWLAAAHVNPAHMKDLMRHSDISTTMDVYGHTLTTEMRAANELVVKQLLKGKGRRS